MTPSEILAIKAAVRERDEFRCTECGMTSAEHVQTYGRDLEVHRVVPGLPYSLEPGACQLLCVACHGPKPRRSYGTCWRPLALQPDEAQQLQELADRNNRPLLWQLRLILHQALRDEGLWPPPQQEGSDQ